MGARRAGHPVQHVFHTDKIGEEGIRDEGGKGEKNQVLEALFQNFFNTQGGTVQGHPLVAVPFDPGLDSMEDEFQEDRLRTGPAAPETACQGGEEEEAECGAKQDEHQVFDILGPENVTEQDELPFEDVELDGRQAIHLDPGDKQIKQDQESTDQPPAAGKKPLNLLRIHPQPFTVFVEGVEGRGSMSLRCGHSGHGLRGWGSGGFVPEIIRDIPYPGALWHLGDWFLQGSGGRQSRFRFFPG